MSDVRTIGTKLHALISPGHGDEAGITNDVLLDELKQAAETLPEYGSPLRTDHDYRVHQECYALEYRHWHLVGAARFGSLLVIDALHLTGDELLTLLSYLPLALYAAFHPVLFEFDGISGPANPSGPVVLHSSK